VKKGNLKASDLRATGLSLWGLVGQHCALHVYIDYNLFGRVDFKETSTYREHRRVTETHDGDHGKRSAFSHLLAPCDVIVHVTCGLPGIELHASMTSASLAVISTSLLRELHGAKRANRAHLSIQSPAIYTSSLACHFTHRPDNTFPRTVCVVSFPSKFL